MHATCRTRSPSGTADRHDRVWRDGFFLNRARPGTGKVKGFFSAFPSERGKLKERDSRTHRYPKPDQIAEKNKGELVLDTMVFVVSLCAVALGILLSHVLEQRLKAGKKPEN